MDALKLLKHVDKQNHNQTKPETTNPLPPLQQVRQKKKLHHIYFFPKTMAVS